MTSLDLLSYAQKLKSSTRHTVATTHMHSMHSLLQMPHSPALPKPPTPHAREQNPNASGWGPRHPRSERHEHPTSTPLIAIFPSSVTTTTLASTRQVSWPRAGTPGDSSLLVACTQRVVGLHIHRTTGRRGREWGQGRPQQPQHWRRPQCLIH